MTTPCWHVLALDQAQIQMEPVNKPVGNMFEAVKYTHVCTIWLKIDVIILMLSLLYNVSQICSRWPGICDL